MSKLTRRAVLRGTPAAAIAAGAKLAPDEQLALRQICRDGDLLLVEGLPFLLVPVTPATLDALAAFEAAAEDLEQDNEDCCTASDDAGAMAIFQPIGAEPHEDEDAEPCVTPPAAIAAARARLGRPVRRRGA